ncbi:hypothetical protein AB0G55_31855 [Streptomyces toyocaensis]|nr:hypothetical protein [Streptomyces toyocaensis]
MARRARRKLPQSKVVVLPGATHHSLPLTAPQQLNEHLTAFLG